MITKIAYTYFFSPEYNQANRDKLTDYMAMHNWLDFDQQEAMDDAVLSGKGWNADTGPEDYAEKLKNVNDHLNRQKWLQDNGINIWGVERSYPGAEYAFREANPELLKDITPVAKPSKAKHVLGGSALLGIPGALLGAKMAGGKGAMFLGGLGAALGAPLGNDWYNQHVKQRAADDKNYSKFVRAMNNGTWKD